MASYTDPQPAYLHLRAPLSAWCTGFPGVLGMEASKQASRLFPKLHWDQLALIWKLGTTRLPLLVYVPGSFESCCSHPFSCLLYLSSACPPFLQTVKLSASRVESLPDVPSLALRLSSVLSPAFLPHPHRCLPR